MSQPDLHRWQELNYLSRGNSRQRAAYHTLQDLRVMHVLARFTPILVGTLPIGIDIPTSDLDIICEAKNLDAISKVIRNAYSHQNEFTLKFKSINGQLTVIATFNYQGFPIQIFAQPIPVDQQNAFRHMLVEARLLEIGGTLAWEEIQKLKLTGLKTEPAFALYFNIPGDPYACLLELSTLSIEDLRASLDIEIAG